MGKRHVIWTPAVREKLFEYKSARFTAEETLDFMAQFISGTEKLLKNHIIEKSYTEEFGKYKGISRVVVKKFRVYFKIINADIVILAVLFPGEK